MHVVFERLIVLLAIELSDLYRGGVDRGVSVDAGVNWCSVCDGAVKGSIFRVVHDKGEMAVQTATEFRRNQNSVCVELALKDAKRE